jgi:hypothetical protein
VDVFRCLPGTRRPARARAASLDSRGQFGVAALAGQQAGVGAGLGNMTVVEHDDLVGVADGGQPVRDGDGGAASSQRAMRAGRLGPLQVRQRADPALTPAQPARVVVKHVLDRASDGSDGIAGTRPR